MLYIVPLLEYIMRNAGLEEAQAGIKISRISITNTQLVSAFGGTNAIYFTDLKSMQDHS